MDSDGSRLVVAATAHMPNLSCAALKSLLEDFVAAGPPPLSSEREGRESNGRRRVEMLWRGQRQQVGRGRGRGDIGFGRERKDGARGEGGSEGRIISQPPPPSRQ